MLSKIYIHQYRCLQNFEIDLEDLNSALLLGRNGSGKSSFFAAIEVLQKIGRGVTPIKDLITRDDFAFSETHKPIIFDIAIKLKGKKFEYFLEIDLPENFREPKVKSEILSVDGKKIIERAGGRTLLRDSAQFTLDWHHIGLPLISVNQDDDPIAILKAWFANIIVLSPYPRRFSATSKMETQHLDRDGQFVLDWIRNSLAEFPSLYGQISDFLKERMPDFELLKFETTGKDEKELIFLFKDETKKIELNFSQLSDGEKIYILTAVIVASIQNHHQIETPLLCLWDEPDNFISLLELNQFITACRKAFENSNNNSQLVFTTHNSQVINEFSGHNTFILSRTSHSQPTRVAKLKDKTYLSASVVAAYENGELD